MKILVAGFLGMLISTATCLSQGLIYFSGGASTATRMSTNNFGLATGPTAANTTATPLFYYAMFASSSQSSIGGSTDAITGYSFDNRYVFNNLGGGTASTGWVLVGMATNTLIAGRFSAMSQGTTSGGQGALNADSSLTVQGIAGGGTAYIVVIGWSSDAGGSTVAGMMAWYNSPFWFGEIGQSAVATVQLGDGGGFPPSNPFGSGTGQVPGFVMGPLPIPEPGAMALAVVGGASMLLFRRRK